MYSFPASTTLAALTIASAASMEPINPFVSTRPSASDIENDDDGRRLTYCSTSNNYSTIAASHDSNGSFDVVAHCGRAGSRQRARDGLDRGLQQQGNERSARGNALAHV